jgi:hypothetical protein
LHQSPERYASARRRRHKKLTDWGRQVLLQTSRWLPERDIIAVADSRYAVIDLRAGAKPPLGQKTEFFLLPETKSRGIWHFQICLQDPSSQFRELRTHGNGKHAGSTTHSAEAEHSDGAWPKSDAPLWYCWSDEAVQTGVYPDG